MVEINVTDATGKQPKKGGFFANQPENNNLLEKTAFKLVIPKAPELTYFCQSISLPGISISTAEQTTMFNNLLYPAGKIKHDTFSATFLVNEDMSNWLEIYNWIKSSSNYINFEEWVGDGYAIVDNAVLYVLSSKNNLNLEAQFYGLFPISLGSISFDYTDSELQVITSTVEFSFSRYTIEVK